jgi:hypothetical protein
MSYKLHDLVIIRGVRGRIIREGLPNNFTVLLEDGKQLWVSNSEVPTAKIYGPEAGKEYATSKDLVKFGSIGGAAAAAPAAADDEAAMLARLAAARATSAAAAAAREDAARDAAAAFAARPTAGAVAPTMAGPIPSATTYVAPASSTFKLSRRPCGRRSYDIDTTSASAAAAAAAGSTTIPPPVFGNPESTLSFLSPRRKNCAPRAAGIL